MTLTISPALRAANLPLLQTKDAPFDDLESMVDYAKANGPLAVAINASPHKLLLAAIGRETGGGVPIRQHKKAEPKA